MNTTTKIGAVLTVGGGIGGVQAALDLAESGFKVYLLDEKPGIGGVMAQLDKTFPTNDCSACMFSPKLVTVGQNPNIEVLAYSRIEEVSGEPGSFRVKVRKKARYIDVEKCKNCGDCTAVCPVSVPDEFNQSLNQRKAVYRLFSPDDPSIIPDKQGRPRSLCRGLSSSHTCSRLPGFGPQRQIPGSPKPDTQGLCPSIRLRSCLRALLRGEMLSIKGR
jgi:heterodisulfide reductase subunit A-like polyferredoxin